MVSTLLSMGLSFTEIKNLTDNEYIMIMATKIAIKDKEAEQMAANKPAMPARPRPRTGGMY